MRCRCGEKGEEGAWAEQASGRWEGSGSAYFTQDDLRGQVLGGPTQGPGAAFHTLGKTEVCHLWAQECAVGWEGGRVQAGLPGVPPCLAQWAPECSPAGR